MSQAQYLTRNAVDCLPRGELERRLEQSRPLRVKLGVDPTSADLHLGHTVVFRKLREFQDAGHVAVLILGDYTARVGDPSGRSATRPVLSGEEIDAHAQTYLEQATKVLRDDDRQIIEIVRDFFATLDLPSHRHGIDVGAGTNLYPALTMLPLCDEITLYEYATSNVSWLQREIQSYSPSWDPFWDLLTKEPLYKSIESPREVLAARARIETGSVFDLPELRWNIGTMSFVAESISSELSEFQAALGSFLRSLRPGAPFAAAFMENSLGYDVSTHRFPAVAITAEDVETCLAGYAEDLEIRRIGTTSPRLRDGYEGMILAIGIVRTE